MRYNAYRFVSKFPQVYWKALNGLIVPKAFETLDTEQLRQGRLPQMAWLYRKILDPVSDHLPWFFLLGLFVATTFGTCASRRRRLLGGLTVLQTAALLLVLPEQKHCAILLLPMTVLGGIGIWRILTLLRPANWKTAVTSFQARPLRNWFAAAGATIALWGLVCLVSYEVSTHERRSLIAAIQEAAQQSVPAPEALRGDKVFVVSRLPSSSQNAAGYLLKISAGPNPVRFFAGTFIFRRIGAGRAVLETTHLLYPNREQFFFVTCDQGGEYGDPRPYTCSVFSMATRGSSLAAVSI